ncbi:MAG TPA: type II toxin-antitoxin system HipA family toxin [Gammaproteobacteria bacterium]|nr:type II toxin-antitoxin system HipA family toxin [Gammaproteobacteria bacterium]
MDRDAVIWTNMGDAPMKMGRLSVTDNECRFNFDPSYLETSLPGMGVLHSPDIIGRSPLVWKRTEYFSVFPELKSLIPPDNEQNFQRKLILAYLAKIGISPAIGFETDWEILLISGHGGIGHNDVFKDDDTARQWYENNQPGEFYTVDKSFGFSLKEFLTWMDQDADILLKAIGPTPSVGGAVPKLLVSIPDSGWDGRIALPTKPGTHGRTDVILKFEQTNQYPGIIDLEALALDIHREAGFAVPRYWKANINGINAIAIERFDRNQYNRPVFMETVYSVMACGDKSITNHYSSSYDRIADAIDKISAPFIHNPAQGKEYLFKRLVLSFLTGNGDLHLENLAIIETEGERHFSPVYDPTPMRAYAIHDMLSPMPFGNYGDFASNDEIVDFNKGLQRLLKKYNISRHRGRLITEELLNTTKDYLDRVNELSTVTDESKKILGKAVLKARKKLEYFMIAPSAS